MERGKEIEVLAGYVNDWLQVVDNAEERMEAVRIAIAEGMDRVERVEREERAALERCVDIPVEKVQEGFALWQAGGFEGQQGRGTALMAVGLGGEKLRRLRRVKERVGKHSLVVVYHGCYIAQAISVDIEVPMLAVYQLMRFVAADGRYAARCRMVWRQHPAVCRLSRPEEIAGLLDAAYEASLMTELYRLEW